MFRQLGLNVTTDYEESQWGLNIQRVKVKGRLKVERITSTIL